MDNIKINIQQIRERIIDASQLSNNKKSVKLVAVSKTKPVSDIELAYQEGQHIFAENYLQEALLKIKFFKEKDIKLEWHFIGSIQTNKAKEIATNFDWVQTIDREKVASKLNQYRPDELSPLQVLIQINISKEKTKSGLIEDKEIFELAEYINKLPKLNLRGIMAIPNPNINDESSYIEMYKLFIRLQQYLPKVNIDTLSIGMTDDLEMAIKYGSTMVRIGSAIFGDRNKINRN